MRDDWNNREKKNKDVTVYRDDALARRQASVLCVVEAFLHLTHSACSVSADAYACISITSKRRCCSP